MSLKINEFIIQSTKQVFFFFNHKNVIFFSIMINAAKNKCSDVSIFKGKARNVDYMSSCKLRVLEKKVFIFLKFFLSVYKYVGTGDAMAASVPCTNSIQLSGILFLFFTPKRKKNPSNNLFQLQLAYTSADCTFA